VVALLVLEKHGSTLATIEVLVCASGVISENLVWGDYGVEREFHVVCGKDTDRPAGSRGGDDAMVRLCGSSAMQIVKLTDGVGSREDLDLGLDGTLSEVTTPKNHLGGFDVVGDIEISDGTSAALGGSSLHGGLGRSIKDLLCSGPGFLHSVGIGDFGTKLEWEFVASGGRNFQGLGSRLEFEHGTEGGHVTVFAFDVDRVDSTDRSDPQFDKCLQGTSVSSDVVGKTLGIRGDVPGSDSASSLHFAHGDVRWEHIHEGVVHRVVGGSSAQGRVVVDRLVQGGGGGSLARRSEGRRRGHHGSEKESTEFHLGIVL